MRPKKILITGGLGFLGSHLTPAFERLGSPVRILDRNEARSNSGAPVGETREFVRGDYRDPDLVKAACQGADCLVHLAWSSVPGTAEADSSVDLQDNVVSSARLFDMAAQAGVETILFASSGGTVYGPSSQPSRETDLPAPISAYGVAKLAVEHYLRLCCSRYGIRGLALRFANPYGRIAGGLERAQGAIEIFMKRLLLGLPLPVWGNGGTVRDFFYIEDLVSAVRLLLLREAHGFEIFNVGSGEGHSLGAVLRQLESVSGMRPNLQTLPARKFDVPYNVLDPSRLKEATGWRPEVGLEAGMRQTWLHLTEDWLPTASPHGGR